MFRSSGRDSPYQAFKLIETTWDYHHFSKYCVCVCQNPSTPVHIQLQPPYSIVEPAGWDSQNMFC